MAKVNFYRRFQPMINHFLLVISIFLQGKKNDSKTINLIELFCYGNYSFSKVEPHIIYKPIQESNLKKIINAICHAIKFMAILLNLHENEWHFAKSIARCFEKA